MPETFPYTIDPQTGLPQLPEDYAFKVEPCYYYKDNVVEVTNNYSMQLYSMSIVQLEKQRFSSPKAVYKKNRWGFTVFSHMTERTPLPRDIKRYAVNGFDVYIAERFNSIEDLPSDTTPEALEKATAWEKHLVKKGYSSENRPYFRFLELNDKNILDAAVKAYQEWKNWVDKTEKDRIKREAQKKIEDLYVGLYPPKGIRR